MERLPKAFISCSLRKQDKKFVDLVEYIVKKNGFQPFGTVGKYVNDSAPVPVTMVEEMKKADCLVIAATPRYHQKDIHNSNNISNGLSEMIQVEAGMASMKGLPIIVFVQKGTHVGNYLSSSTQYIEIDFDNYKESLAEKLPLIKSLFYKAALKIQEKWDKVSKQRDKEGTGALLQVAGVIGIGALLINLFSSDEKE